MTSELRAVTPHRQKDHPRAILLLHGADGRARVWKGWPEALSSISSLDNWDIHSVLLPGSLTFDVVGLLSSDPLNVNVLARELAALLTADPLLRYAELAILAHSLGGVVAQRCILSDATLQGRLSHLLMFATPSAGLERASPFQFWKHQSRGLARDGGFIRGLREEWRARFGERPPFRVCAVAADHDEFVPGESSLEPFPVSDRWVVSGNHWSIVEAAGPNTPGVQVAARAIAESDMDPDSLETARLALEARDFDRVVEILWPRRRGLKEPDAINLALALDSQDYRDQAIEILGRFENTDAMGVLAGRHKRRWLQQRRSADADRALSLYSAALDKAVAASDWPQALYAAINCAFMTMAYQGDSTACRDFASRAREYCRQSPPDFWTSATLGEASIYLGEPAAALEAYRDALARRPTPRQFDSMYSQALRATDLVGDEELGSELATLLQPAIAASETIYLDSIDLENIRCFPSLKVDLRHKGQLRKRITVLGDNARGKSTLLRAIAIGLCSASDAVALMKRTSGPFLRTGEARGRITLHLSAEPSGRRWTLEKRLERGRDGTETLEEGPMPDDFPRDRLFVCGYGTQRTAMATASFDTYSPRLAVATLFDPGAVLQNPEVVLLRQPPAFRRQLQKKLLDVMLLESSDDGLDESSQGLQLRGPFGVSPFAVLSDGYRSTAQWLMDLFAWLVLSRRLPAPEEPGGILLVDEIEQHLHPRWQRYILQRLAAQLPHMQIITTTHTPLVASAVADLDAACLVRFSSNQAGGTEVDVIEPEQLHGKRADQVLADVFDLITTRNPGSSRDLEELARLRGLSTRTPDEESALQRLESSLKDGLGYGENALERRVRSVITGTLDKMLQEPPAEPFDAETRRQLKEMLGEAKS
jgi:tetratricopeptide (TPR) repeat protein